MLRLPLAWKITGANLVVVLAALLAIVSRTDRQVQDARLLLILGGALAGSLAVNAVLVALALRPLAALEATARRIWSGDLSARVAPSPLADRELQRVEGAINLLLEGLSADRARVRELAALVIHAADEERARLARELHDSTAQSLAALLLEVSVVARGGHEPATLDRLERIRRIASDVLDEVRSLAQTVHPRVLDDLGLGAALQSLARECELRTTVRVEVVVGDSAGEIPLATSSVLFRVAQEALANALRHGGAQHVTLRAGVEDGIVRVEIADDGVGFRVDEAERRRPGMGLFVMRERVALLDGTLALESTPGRGTRVIACVPVMGKPVPATVGGTEAAG